MQPVILRNEFYLHCATHKKQISILKEIMPEFGQFMYQSEVIRINFPTINFLEK